MIKIKFVKFILLFALALVSLNACYPSEYECADNTELLSTIKTQYAGAEHENSASSTEEKDTHYCLCSLTCHTMFVSFSSVIPFKAYPIDFLDRIQYTPHVYPDFFNELEKPPIV